MDNFIICYRFGVIEMKEYDPSDDTQLSRRVLNKYSQVESSMGAYLDELERQIK